MDWLVPMQLSDALGSALDELGVAVPADLDALDEGDITALKAPLKKE